MSELAVENLRIQAMAFQQQLGVDLDGVVAEVKGIEATDENLQAALQASTRSIDALKIANKLGRQHSQRTAIVALESIYKWLLLVKKAANQRKSEILVIKTQVAALSNQMTTLISEGSPANSPRASSVKSNSDELGDTASPIDESLKDSGPEQRNVFVRLFQWLFAQISQLFSSEKADSESIAEPVVEEQQHQAQKKQQYQWMFRRNENIVAEYFKNAQQGELPQNRVGIKNPQWVTAGGDTSKQ